MDTRGEARQQWKWCRETVASSAMSAAAAIARRYRLRWIHFSDRSGPRTPSVSHAHRLESPKGDSSSGGIPTKGRRTPLSGGTPHARCLYSKREEKTSFMKSSLSSRTQHAHTHWHTHIHTQTHTHTHCQHRFQVQPSWPAWKHIPYWHIH